MEIYKKWSGILTMIFLFVFSLITFNCVSEGDSPRRMTPGPIVPGNGTCADDGGIGDLRTNGVGSVTPAVTLRGVYVTFLDTNGFSTFTIQKGRNCPALNVAAGNDMIMGAENPVHPSRIVSGGLAVGDQIDITVRSLEEFSGLLQIADDDLRASDVTRTSTGYDVLENIAVELGDITELAEEHEGILVKVTTGTLTAATVQGGFNVTFTIGGTTYNGRFNGLGAGRLCATGTFSFPNGAVISEFSGNYQVVTHTDADIMVAASGCTPVVRPPLPSTCPDDGGIGNLRTNGAGAISPPVTLTGVYVTFLDTNGFSTFNIQRGSTCPAIAVAAGNDQVSGADNPIHPTRIVSGGLAVGDQINITVRALEEFSGLLQVDDAQLMASDVTRTSTGYDVLANIAVELSTISTLAEAHESILVKVTTGGTPTATTVAGSNVAFTLGAATYNGHFNGLTTGSLCATGTFSFPNGAVISEFSGNYQVTTHQNADITVATDGCPVVSTAPDHMIITRWTYGFSSGGGNNQEFVEIANPTSSAIDINGYTLRRGASADDCNSGSGTTLANISATTSIPSQRFHLFTTSVYENNLTGSARLGMADPAPTGDTTMTAGITSSNDVYLCNGTTEIDRTFGSLSNTSGRAAERGLLSSGMNYQDSDMASDFTRSTDANSYTIRNSATTTFP